MVFGAPRIVVPTTDERELLLRVLQRQREEVVATADGLTDEQAGWTPDARLLPVAGVINHLTHVEWRWIEGRYLQSDFPPRYEEFRLNDISLSNVIDAYWNQVQQTDRLVRSAPSLEVQCLGCEGDGPPAHVLLGLETPLDLRWVVLHLIEETAHHAGHADATREMLDGKTMR
jgi:hypothetical protein